MSIAILCPTRGRPEKCKRMVESAKETASTPIRFELVVNGQDLLDYQRQFPHDGKGNVVDNTRIIVLPDNLPTAHKWNLAAQMANKEPDLYMFGSDDIYFDTPGWDVALLDHYNKLNNKIHVYHLQDSRSEDGTPHPIVTREYIEAMGYFCPPIFLHWYVDTWTVAIAKANNCFTHMKDYLLVHDKPSDKGVCDETHSRIRQWGWHERDKWVNDKCQHFLEGECIRLHQIIAFNQANKGLDMRGGKYF